MLRSYFRIAWRNIKKHRYFSLLNIIGLSSGLACAIIIYLWVHDETSMDKFHKNDARLYQAMSHIKLPDGIHTQKNTPAMLAIGSAVNRLVRSHEPLYPLYFLPWRGRKHGLRHYQRNPDFVDWQNSSPNTYVLVAPAEQTLHQRQAPRVHFCVEL